MSEPKYKSGAYRVLLFNRYGTKEDDLPAASWSDGMVVGQEHAGDGSFVIIRTVYNSLDPHPTAVRNLEEGE